MSGGIIEMIIATHHDVENSRTLDWTGNYNFLCTTIKVGLDGFCCLEFP